MDGLKFILKVEPGNDATREYITEKQIVSGLECDGYFFVGFKDGKAKFGSMMNITIEEIMEYLRQDGDVASEILHAALIAKGYRDAHEVRVKCEMAEAKREGLKAFADMLLGKSKG